VKNFTVVWHPDVEEALAALVLEHWGTPRLEQLSRASAQIDQLLGDRPGDVGSAVGVNLRFLTVPPLTVLYAVYEDDRTVALLEYRYRSLPQQE
jgi:hypothetical protein